MRTCRFEGKQGVQYGDHVLDLARVGFDGDLRSPDGQRQLALMLKGKPPQHALRRADNLAYQPPVDSKRVVLRGGAQQDFAPTVLAPGATLPQGPWQTGLVAVIGPDFNPKKWEAGVDGFTIFQAVESNIMYGPWIVANDEIRDPLQLMFSAFVDDLPRIRPVKALMDWKAELAAAHEVAPLQEGDLVGLTAPPQEAEGEVRSAMVLDGNVVCRLLADIAD